MDPANSLRNTFSSLSNSIRTNFNMFPQNPDIDNFSKNYYLVTIIDEISFCQYIMELTDLKLKHIINEILKRNYVLNLEAGEIIICCGDYKIYCDEDLNMFYDQCNKRGEISLTITALMLSSHSGNVDSDNNGVKNKNEINQSPLNNEGESPNIMTASSVMSVTSREVFHDLTFDVNNKKEKKEDAEQQQHSHQDILLGLDETETSTVGNKEETLSLNNEQVVIEKSVALSNDNNEIKNSNPLIFHKEHCQSFVWCESEHIDPSSNSSNLEFKATFQVFNKSQTLWHQDQLCILPREGHSFEAVEYYIEQCHFDFCNNLTSGSYGRTFECKTGVCLKKEAVDVIFEQLAVNTETTANVEWHIFVKNSWPMQLLCTPLVTTIVLFKSDKGHCFVNGGLFKEVVVVQEEDVSDIVSVSKASEIEYILPSSPPPEEQQRSTEEWVNSSSVKQERDETTMSFVILEELGDINSISEGLETCLKPESDNNDLENQQLEEPSSCHHLSKIPSNTEKSEYSVPEPPLFKTSFSCPNNKAVNSEKNDNNGASESQFRINSYQYENPFTVAMNNLFMMGFYDHSRNMSLLNKYNCDLSKVVQELTENDCGTI